MQISTFIPVTIALPILVGLTVAMLFVSFYLFMVEKDRKKNVSDRVGASRIEEARSKLMSGSARYRPSWQNWILAVVPAGWLKDPEAGTNLLHAGYDSPVAGIIFAGCRMGLLIVLPIVAFLLTAIFYPRFDLLHQLGMAVVGGIVGFLIPLNVIRSLAKRRRKRIRRSLPDAIDLIIVCLEAGIGLSTALLRVATELAYIYPDLAKELVIVNQKSNAGLTRDVALRGVFERTGVEEVRFLVAGLIQSEKWGSSIANALRASAETFRRERSQLAEKAAATAPTKMTFPLALLIFPALMAVILGPAAMNISAGFLNN